MLEESLYLACSCYIEGANLYLLMTALLMPMPLLLIMISFGLYFFLNKKS